MSLFKRALPMADMAAAKAARNEYKADAAEVGLREEVIAELVAAGVARHVAAEMTNTPAKLLAQAERLELA